eukprot:615483-Rhodomonas_salina.1
MATTSMMVMVMVMVVVVVMMVMMMTTTMMRRWLRQGDGAGAMLAGAVGAHELHHRFMLQHCENVGCRLRELLAAWGACKLNSHYAPFDCLLSRGIDFFDLEHHFMSHFLRPSLLLS